MLKTVIFDCDGLVVKRETYFSKRFARDFAVPEADILPFFQNEFLRCEIGKADLKEEIKKYLPKWGWKGSASELLDYWFKHERQLDTLVLDYIASLRAQGIYCCLTANNEKYRTNYLSKILGLEKVFDKIFSSANIGYLKPQQEFWQAIYDFDKMGNKREVLVLDDKPEFVESARRFGFFGHQYTTLEDLQSTVENLLGV